MLRAVRKLIWIGLPAFAALAGCAYGEVRQVLRAQFASELACREVQIEKKGYAYLPDGSDKERYKITGCGVERTYTCARDAGLVSYDEPACTWVAGDPDRPQVAAAKPAGEDPFTDSASEGTEPASEPAAEAVPAAAPAPPAAAQPSAPTTP